MVQRKVRDYSQIVMEKDFFKEQDGRRKGKNKEEVKMMINVDVLT